MSNDPATTATRRADCNREGPPPLDAAHGSLQARKPFCAPTRLERACSQPPSNGGELIDDEERAKDVRTGTLG